MFPITAMGPAPRLSPSGSATGDAIDPAVADLLEPSEPAPARPATRLTVHRTSKQDVQDRQVIVSLDGKRLAELLYGDTFTCEIEPGAHRLRASNTLVWKTAEFLAPAGSHVHFTCINRAPRGMYYMLALFGVAPLFLSLKPGLPRFVRS